MAVLIRRSSVAGKVPATTDLSAGELALNTNDGRLFMKKTNGGVDSIVEISSVTSLLNKTISGSVTLSALEYSNAMIVLSGALTANTVVTVPNTAHAFIVVNKTTGNYSLSVQATGTSSLVNVTQGTAESLLCDTTGVYATASTTGVEFAKIIPVTGSVVADITYAGALLVVTTSGVQITLPPANTYQGGIGFGILNVSSGNITVVKSGSSSDTSPVGLPLTVKPNDSYYLASDNTSVWQCVWYSNPISPTFGAITTQGAVTVGGNFTANGTSTLNGGATIAGTVEVNGTIDSTGNITVTNSTNSTIGAIEPGSYSGGLSIEAYNIGNTVKKNILLNGFGGRVLAGASANDDGASILQVAGDFHATIGKIIATRYGQTSAIRLRSASGTFGSATATPTSTQVSTIVASGYDGTNFQDGASIDMWSEGVFSSTSSPTNIRFYTAPTGSITKQERMRITAAGRVLIGQTTDDGATQLQVTGDVVFNNNLTVGANITSSGGKITGGNSAGALTATNGGGAGQTSIWLQRTGGATNQKTWEFLQDGSGNLNIRVVNDAYNASTTAIQVNRGSGIGLTTMTLMPSGGRVLVAGATDDTSSALQVNGVIASQTGGFKFPDGTVQTTANGVTAPTSTLYTPLAGVTVIATSGYVSPFVQVFKNNLRLIPGVDFTTPDGTNINLTVAATGRDRYEVLTSVIYSPSAVFAPTSQTFNITAGQNTISVIYNVNCVWVFKNSMKLIPVVDFNATTGTNIVFTVNSESTTDIYEVVTFQPFVLNGMLPLSGGTMTGNLNVNTSAATNNTNLSASAGYARTTTYQTGTATRWVEGVDGSSESGSNAGSNWNLSRYNDAGTLIDTPVAVNRATGVMTINDGLILPDGYLQLVTPSGRNRATNGAHLVAQRGAGSYTNGVSGYSGADMFSSNNGAGGTFTQALGSISFGGIARKALVQTVTATGASFATAGNLWLGVQTRFEGVNVYDMLGGYATLSFLFNTNVTGTYSVQLFDNVGSNCYVASFSAVANTPQRVVIPVLMPATLGIPNTTGLGLLCTIGCVSGTTYQTSTLNAWQTGNLISASTSTNWTTATNNFIAVGELQFEPGKINTPFERLSIAQEFDRCQRYYEVVPFGGHVVYNQGASSALFTVYFNTQKRINPVLGYTLTGVSTENTIPVGSITSLIIDRNSTQHSQILINGTGGIGAATCGRIIGTGTGSMTFSAEL